ncbi:Hypothetical protein A7982_03701 [Minicystis rosea]|nr:Hypothetical protein A7982_03701 [Minicystis rosea]
MADPEARPRLIVPGSIEMLPLDVGTEHEILCGELAGYLLGEDITNWKNSYTFVALEDLSLAERCRYAPHLAAEWAAMAPEGEGGAEGYRSHHMSRGDGPRRPHLVKLLSRARLLLVGSTDRRDLGPAEHVRLDGSARIVEVGFARNADDYFHLHMRREGKTLASIGGAFYSIFSHLELEGRAQAGVESRDRLLDRVVSAASEGLADSAQIALAFWMADVSDLDGWEAHLAAVAARAEPHAELAGAVVRALADAPAYVDAVTLPVYGVARRLTLPGFALHDALDEGTLAAHVDLEGLHTLRVPARSTWVIDQADSDAVPRPPPHIFRAASALPRRSAARPRSAIALLVLAVFVVAGVLVLRSGGRPGEACRRPRDCRSRLCLRAASPDVPGYCTRACTRDTDCDRGLTCRLLPFDSRRVCQR